jgi:cystathionine beta-lyase
MEQFDFSKGADRRGTYSTQWDYIADRFGRDDLLPFTISDMDFEVAPSIKAALQQRVGHGVFGYSRWNHADFKGAVSGWFKKRFNAVVNEEAIAYSPSIIYSLSRLIEYYSEKGDGVIMQLPAYDAFFTTVNGLERRVMGNRLIYDAEGTAQIDFDELEELAKTAKVLLICNPHNPTGRVWSRDELARMMAVAVKYKLAVISDDAHMDIIYAPYRYTPITEVWGSYKKAALITSTAKGFNTASLGGSYIIFNDAVDREFFMADLKVRGLSSAPILGIIAVIAAYTTAGAWLDAFNKAMYANLEFTRDYLRAHLPSVSMAKPQGTYFAWLNAGALGLNAAEMQRRLIEKGRVAIMDGSVYRQDNPLYLRLNVACPHSKLEDGLRRLVLSLK